MEAMPHDADFSTPPHRFGFSLVELSIVLVILGLLTGGILAGQSLIKAAQLRAVSTEYSRYLTATQTFKDKYFAIPGDFRDATRFWGLQYTNGTVGCNSNSGAAVTGTATGSCDGDGNGTLGWSTASVSSELVQFWRQLALAGLIEGTYTGITGAASYCNSTPGTNIPVSKYSSGSWAVSANQGGGGLVNWTPPVSYNSLIFGSTTASFGKCYADGSILAPEDAWNIDTKLDDGKPGTGNVRGQNNGVCVSGSGAGAAAAAAATYLLTGGTGCFLEFTQGVN